MTIFLFQLNMFNIFDEYSTYRIIIINVVEKNKSLINNFKEI